MKATDKEILSQIKQVVLAVDAEAELILFGSRARGDYKEDSDWDVLVLSENKVDGELKRKISDSIFDISLNHSAAISTLVVNKNNWYKKYSGYPLFFEVKKEGIQL